MRTYKTITSAYQCPHRLLPSVQLSGKGYGLNTFLPNFSVVLKVPNWELVLALERDVEGDPLASNAALLATVNEPFAETSLRIVRS